MDKNLFFYEREAAAQGYQRVCGCDEAGAGPLAGPVCAAAVILPFDVVLQGLDDSKKLTERKREGLEPLIKELALAWSVAFVSAEEIDEMDILNARIKAMQLAMDSLALSPDYALIDGNRDHGSRCAITTPHKLIVKGDSCSASIAAASILAKVSRDRRMLELARQYPQYGFEQHKGYGTKLHYQRLETYGPSPVHRRTFLKAPWAGESGSSWAAGARARWESISKPKGTRLSPGAGAAGLGRST